MVGQDTAPDVVKFKQNLEERLRAKVELKGTEVVVTNAYIGFNKSIIKSKEICWRELHPGLYGYRIDIDRSTDDEIHCVLDS